MPAYIVFVICAALSLPFSTAWSEELQYNLIQLSAAAEADIANDVMTAVVRASAEANTAREAARLVNDDMAWALKMSEKYEEIKKQTLGYQTNPHYSKQAIIGWKARQELKLESSDFASLSELIGTLQERLMVGAMQFSASPEMRHTAEGDLIRDALEAFEQKAKLITATLGARDYRIVSLQVSDPGRPVPPMRGFQMEAMAVQGGPPQVEGGESRLVINVDGSIQLVF